MKELCRKFLASADYPFTESEPDELCHSLREQRTASAMVNACIERIVAPDLPPGEPGRFWKRLHKKRYFDCSFQALSIGIARARTVNQAPLWEH